MSGANTFGSRLAVTTFGESHGPALGCVVDGVPAGVEWDEDLLRTELRRRRPGGRGASPRSEPDEPELLSGVHWPGKVRHPMTGEFSPPGVTIGTPIAILIRNKDARPEEYEQKPDRRGHADEVLRQKYGTPLPSGGGRSSGRETVARVAAGAVARMIATSIPRALRTEAFKTVRVEAFVSRVGSVGLSEEERAAFDHQTLTDDCHPQDAYPLRFPSSKADDALSLVEYLGSKNDSIGGEVTLWIDHLPVGLGQPTFRKLRSDLGQAALSIGAVTAVEFGAGFSAGEASGSGFHGLGNGYGGLRGGLSDGSRIELRVAIKPPSSIGSFAKTGRHDAFLPPRVVPVLEAMAWLVIADHLLWARADRA